MEQTGEGGFPSARGGNGRGLLQQDQLDFAQAEYDERFSNGPTGVQDADARGGVVLNDASGPTVYEGEASYYNLPGNKTASGELFDPNANTAALTADKVPLGTRAIVEYTSQTPNGPLTNRLAVPSTTPVRSLWAPTVERSCRCSRTPYGSRSHAPRVRIPRGKSTAWPRTSQGLSAMKKRFSG